MDLVRSYLTICFLLLTVTPAASWRRRRCSVTHCRVGDWSSWSACTRPCGGGTQKRTRSKTVKQSCGGGCPYDLLETRSCNTGCCPIDCQYTGWSSWSACKGCGTSSQSRRPVISRPSSCGGKDCPSVQTRSCIASP